MASPLRDRSLNVGEYETLKQKVASARAQQRRVESHREDMETAVNRQVDQLRTEMQKHVEDYEAKMDELKKSAAAANERASRFRLQAEKDKKTWQTKHDRALLHAEELTARHKLATEELQRIHEGQLTAEKEEHNAVTHAVMERLDEQLQGRVAEAEEREHTLLQQHARQVAASEAEWQERCEVVEQERDMWRQQMEASGELCSALHAELADANRSKEEGVSHLTERERLLRLQLADKEARNVALAEEATLLRRQMAHSEDVHTREVQAVTSAHEEAVTQLKEAHDGELELVSTRVRRAIEKRTALVAATSEELLVCQRSLEQSEAALRFHQAELLRITRGEGGEGGGDDPCNALAWSFTSMASLPDTRRSEANTINNSPPNDNNTKAIKNSSGTTAGSSPRPSSPRPASAGVRSPQTSRYSPTQGGARCGAGSKGLRGSKDGAVGGGSSSSSSKDPLVRTPRSSTKGPRISSSARSSRESQPWI